MVRSNRPLVEKMTLFWHDHFATSEQDTPLMLAQNRLFRSHALGSFRALLRGVTRDPAMQLFLSLADSTKEHPNENYARELMELFTLGKGYSERDVREAARALTGFRARWSDKGFGGIHYEPDEHDGGVKRILGKTGRFGIDEVLDIVCDHPAPRTVPRHQAVGFFVATPPSPATVRALAATYRRAGLQIKPVVRQILDHPALYRNLDAPDLVKAPIVYIAGALRTTGSHVTDDYPVWLSGDDGPAAVPPAVGRRLGLGPALDVVERGSTAVRARQLHRQQRPPDRAKGRLQGVDETAAGGRDRDRGGRLPACQRGRAQSADADGGALVRRPPGVVARRRRLARRDAAADAASPARRRPGGAAVLNALRRGRR